MEPLEIIIAIVVVVIALCALGVSFIAVVLGFWQAWATRRHNRLTVKPELELALDMHKGYVLINGGLGPAKVTRLFVKFNGNKFNFFDLDESENFMEATKLDELCTWTVIAKSMMIRSGQTVPLITMKDPTNKETRELIANTYPFLVISISYESIYGEKF